MKLLLKKHRTSNGRKNPNCITVNKGGASINGESTKRILGGHESLYINFGLNNEGNFCAYVSYEKNPYLFKAYTTKTKNQLRFNFNTKEQKKSLEPYIGDYDIKYISMNDENGFKEVVLRKI